MRSGRPRTRWLLAAMAMALLLAGSLQACGANGANGAGAANVSASAAQVKFTAGTALAEAPAPEFALRDQTGAIDDLQQMRGHVVILTFLDATCTTECPITAQYLDWTAQFLGKDANKVIWLAMSVNPTNTVAQAETFMHKNQVQVPLRLLMGSQAELAPLWKDYHITVQPGAGGDVEHTLGLYLIDAQGREREWVDAGYDPRALSRDVQALWHAGD